MLHQADENWFLKLCIYHIIVTLREVWPEGDVFGSSDVEPEEELELLKQIIHANLPSEWCKFQIVSFLGVLTFLHHSNIVTLRDNFC